MDGCVAWQGRIDRQGYGRMGGKLAHRVVYEHLVGPIPEGLTIDHLCRNRACVNPDHLEPVTAYENWRRGRSFSVVNAAKTHCVHGHAFDKENTYVGAKGRRHCRRCSVDRSRSYKQRRSAA